MCTLNSADFSLQIVKKSIAVLIVELNVIIIFPIADKSSKVFNLSCVEVIEYDINILVLVSRGRFPKKFIHSDRSTANSLGFIGRILVFPAVGHAVDKHKILARRDIEQFLLPCLYVTCYKLKFFSRYAGLQDQ